MKKTSIFNAAAIIFTALLFASCADIKQPAVPAGPEPEVYTVNFCRGILPFAGYDGAFDTYIADGPKSNTNNGICTELLLGDNNNISRCRALVKFELGGFIPATASIQRAYITLSVNSNSNDNDLKLYCLPFRFDEGIYCNGYSLLYATWYNMFTNGGYYAGMQLAGSLSIPESRSSGYFQVELDKTVVKSWVDNTSANHGLILINDQEGEVTDIPNHIVKIASSESVSAIYRPMLTVMYTLP